MGASGGNNAKPIFEKVSIMLDISVLNGKFLLKTEVDNEGGFVIFTTNEGVYKLFHQQDCCEEVYLYDIEGDIADLQDVVVVSAYEAQQYSEECEDGSRTFTFYSVQTDKGYVWLRWRGESNGYYSESVDFEKVEKVD